MARVRVADETQGDCQVARHIVDGDGEPLCDAPRERENDLSDSYHIIRSYGRAAGPHDDGTLCVNCRDDYEDQPNDEGGKD